MDIKIIGYIGIVCCIAWFAATFKKRPNKSIAMGVVAALFIFSAVAFLPAEKTAPDKAVSSAPASSFAGESAASNEALKTFSTVFIGGYYTPGIDFPAGTYDITVEDGKGEIYYTDPSGPGKTVSLGINGTKQVTGIKLPFGEALSVYGVKIKLESSAADTGNMSERENTATKTVTLKPGTYRVGAQLEEGTYDITALSGEGKIDSDGEGVAFHEVLSSQGKDFEKEFRNLTLDGGNTLTVTGATIKLVPSK